MYIHRNSRSPRVFFFLRKVYWPLSGVWTKKHIKRADENKCFNRSNLRQRQRQSFFIFYFFHQNVCAKVYSQCSIYVYTLANTFAHQEVLYCVYIFNKKNVLYLCNFNKWWNFKRKKKKSIYLSLRWFFFISIKDKRFIYKHSETFMSQKW